MYKLEKYGIKGDLHKWLTSFLTKIEMRVVTEGEQSNKRPFCIPVLHLRLASRLGVHRNQLISGISLSFLVPGFWHMFLVRCSVFDPAPWLLMDRAMSIKQKTTDRSH
jgi:hypothetical protein